MLHWSKKKKEIIRASLIDAEHISVTHKLEVGDYFYLHGCKVLIKEITDANGDRLKVLCIGE